MKMTNWYSLFFLFWIFALSNHSEQKENADTSVSPNSAINPCYTENNTFQAGEEIVYKVYYNWNFVWLSAGEVTFKVDEVGREYHLSAVGKSYPSYEWFYKVRDRYDTYVDKTTLLPRISIKNLEEGGYRLFDRTILHQKNGQAIILRGKTRESAKQEEMKIETCMHDILSIIYHTRNIDFNSFSPGNSFPVKIFMDKTAYPLNVKYLGRDENKHIKGEGKYKTLIFSPEVVAGEIFKENAQMKVWVTDDKNRIPVLIESPVSVGAIKAVLKSYKGLKHEMTAKLDK